MASVDLCVKRDADVSFYKKCSVYPTLQLALYHRDCQLSSSCPRKQAKCPTWLGKFIKLTLQIKIYIIAVPD